MSSHATFCCVVRHDAMLWHSSSSWCSFPSSSLVCRLFMPMRCILFLHSAFSCLKHQSLMWNMFVLHTAVLGRWSKVLCGVLHEACWPYMGRIRLVVCITVLWEHNFVWSTLILCEASSAYVPNVHAALSFRAWILRVVQTKSNAKQEEGRE